jgi:ABC-2 type transport system ATP-binding protein
MGNGNIIVFSKVTRVFGGFFRGPRIKAVDDVTIAVRRGETFGILGPEGSGKTTMLRLMKGLIDPSRGDIEVLGAPAWANTISSQVGYVAADSHLDPRMGCLVALAPRNCLTGLGLKEQLKRTQYLLELIGLPQIAKQRVGDLSPGFQRCLNLAQGLMFDPEVLLLDEPFHDLEAMEADKVRVMIQALGRSGKTIVLTNPWLSNAINFCDRFAVLFAGKLQAQGAITEIFASSKALQIFAPVLSRETTQSVVQKIGREMIVEGTVTNAQMPKPHLQANSTDEAGERREPALGLGLKGGGEIDHERLVRLTARDSGSAPTSLKVADRGNSLDLTAANERLSALLPINGQAESPGQDSAAH